MDFSFKGLDSKVSEMTFELTTLRSLALAKATIAQIAKTNQHVVMQKQIQALPK